MPVKQDLLEILCCPVTKVGLEILTNEMQVELNEKIQKVAGITGTVTTIAFNAFS